jgi:hypothetical protein
MHRPWRRSSWSTRAKSNRMRIIPTTMPIPAKWKRSLYGTESDFMASATYHNEYGRELRSKYIRYGNSSAIS